MKIKNIIIMSTTAVALVGMLIAIMGCGQKELPKVTGEFPNKVAENAAISAEYKDLASALSKDAIDIFMNEISVIPHQSGNEMQLSNYIVDLAKKQGYQYTQLENGVVYFDVPASKGAENLPKIIMQAHLDMVVTTKDPNSVKNTFTPELYYDSTKGTICNENHETNIGSDDAQGIMSILAICKNNQVKHGPLRMLFTVGEETDMDGAKSVTADMLDADYLVNIDGGPVGTLLTSSAGCLQYSYTNNFGSVIPSQKQVMCVEISDLAGGHSGLVIGEKRQNAIKYFTQILKRLQDENIEFAFISASTSDAINAIAKGGEFRLAINESDYENAKKIVNDTFEGEKAKYDKDSNGKINIKNEGACDVPALSTQDTQLLVKTFDFMPQGVLNWSSENVPETSCNLGLLALNNGEFSIRSFFRSNVNQQFEDEKSKAKKFAEENGLTFDIFKAYSPWPNDGKKNFQELFQNSYRNACNFEGKLEDIHAGLELGYFAETKPDLQMVCIGADVADEHAVEETLYTKSLPAHFASILYVMEHIKEAGK